MTLERLWRNVEFVKQVPEQLNQLEMWVMCLLTHGTHWAQICSTGTRLITWWLETTSPNTWLLRRLPSSSTHMVIKELGLVFTELGRPICSKIRQETLLQFQGVPQLPEFLSGWPHHKQPTLPTKQWICWSFGGNCQETDGKISERRKTVELWSFTIQNHTH